MKLDRTSQGANKYFVVNRRKLEALRSHGQATAGQLDSALNVLAEAGVLSRGAPGSDDEHFVIFLRDRHAGVALATYAASAAGWDREYAEDVMAVARRSGTNHPACRDPD